MENNNEQRPRVGIGILIFKEGRVLLGKRKNSHGNGEYAGAGGHLEYMESFQDCARREIKEEVGIEVENIRFLCLVNVKEYAPKHYIDIGLIADYKSGQIKVMEPEKLESWDWYDVNNLPTPLFGMIPKYFEAYTTGKNYFDSI